MEFSYIDGVLGALLVLGLVRGYINGLVIEVSTAAAYVLGVLVALWLSTYVEPLLLRWFRWPHMGIAAFLLVFVVIVILVHIMGNTLTDVLKQSSLNILNRVLGSVFGFIKYAFIMSVLLAVFNFFDEDGKVIPKSETDKSILYPYIDKLAPTVFPHLHFSSVKGLIDI